MLTYYYDEQSENNNSTQNETTSTPTSQSEPDLAAMDRAYNPALIHHLYLGLGHVGKVKRFPHSLLFSFFSLSKNIPVDRTPDIRQVSSCSSSSPWLS